MRPHLEEVAAWAGPQGADRLLAAVQAWNEPRNYNLTPDTSTQGQARTALVDCKPGRTATGEDGVTRTSLTITVNATESANYDGWPETAIRAVLAAEEGKPHRDVGRVESVDVADIVKPEFRPAVAKLPWVVTATFVLMYRLT